MARELVAARTQRLLDEYLEERADAKLALGPLAGTEVVLRLHEVSNAVALEARRLLRVRATEAAEVLLADRAIASRSSQIVGEHETIKELLARLPVRLRARHDVYTSAAARNLLADIDRCPARNLAAVLDYEMEDRWPFTVNPPRTVAAKPLRWFTVALRRAVSRKHGFAVVFDTTLL